MRVINGVLLYSENEIGKNKSISELGKDKLPKKKFYIIKKIEDYTHSKDYTFLDDKGQPKTVNKKFITQAGLKNREQRRAEEKSVKKKGHTLELHHREIKKRRELRKLNKKRRINV